MADTDEDPFWYPTVEDILTIHDDIIEEDEDSEPGVRDPDQIQYAIDYIQHGPFGAGPESIHEKAFHLMRLLAANHWFVDGNKRTALNTVEMFYLFNGYELRTGEDFRSMLKLFSVREDIFDETVAVQHFSNRAEEDSVDWEEVTTGQFFVAALVSGFMESFEENPEDFEVYAGGDEDSVEEDSHHNG
jgi:death-on-curing protein